MSEYMKQSYATAPTAIDDLIEAIVKIGNNPEFMKYVEPQVMQPLQLDSWMVRRTLKVLLALQGVEDESNRKPKKKNERILS